MIFFHDRQKADIGLQYLLDRLEPHTPFGRWLVNDLHFFSPEEIDGLNAELDNVGRAKEFCKTDGLEILLDSLSAFKDIEPTVSKAAAASYVLDEVELFEIKSFLLSHGELAEAYAQRCGSIGFTDIAFTSLDDALSILDPEGRKQRSFYVYESYSENLKALRIEKRRLEDAIREEDDPDEKNSLRSQRLNLVCNEDAEEQLIRAALTEKLQPYLPEINKAMKTIGYLDFLLQKGKLALDLNGTRPQIKPGAVSFTQLRNPYFADILQKQRKSFTPISIECGMGTTVLTGANMGGKSVALKTVTLSLALLHAGFFVFAESASSPLFHSINLVSEDLQSVDKGLSTFAAEVVRLQQICNQMQRGCSFVALDELGRGTNPGEGAAIAKAVAAYMNSKNVVALITTHFDGVTAPEFSCYQVVGLKNANMEALRQKILLKSAKAFELISEHMDYSLVKIPPGTEPPKDARNICRLLNLNDEILNLIETSL